MHWRIRWAGFGVLASLSWSLGACNADVTGPVAKTPPLSPQAEKALIEKAAKIHNHVKGITKIHTKDNKVLTLDDFTHEMSDDAGHKVVVPAKWLPAWQLVFDILGTGQAVVDEFDAKKGKLKNGKQASSIAANFTRLNAPTMTASLENPRAFDWAGPRSLGQKVNPGRGSQSGKSVPGGSFYLGWEEFAPPGPITCLGLSFRMQQLTEIWRERYSWLSSSIAEAIAAGAIVSWDGFTGIWGEFTAPTAAAVFWLLGVDHDAELMTVWMDLNFVGSWMRAMDCIYAGDGSYSGGSGNMYDVMAKNVTHIGGYDPNQGTSWTEVCFEIWWQYKDENGNVFNEVYTGEHQCYRAQDDY